MTTLAPGTHDRASFWSTIKEAVRGSHQDYTEVPIGHAVLLLAVPMVLEMLMESVFVVADVFFVGRLGPDAVATVGITESLMTIMYALAIGLSIGAAATVARRVGEKDHDNAARSAVQSIVIGLGAAAIFGTVGALFGPQLLANEKSQPATSNSNFCALYRLGLPLTFLGAQFELQLFRQAAPSP